MITAFVNYLKRCGVEFDVACNVLTGGQLGQTVSYRCAVAWRAGKPVGCAMCWFLNIFVQRNHCPDQFTSAPTPWFDMVRAGIAFAVGIAALVAIGHGVVEAVRSLL